MEQNSLDSEFRKSILFTLIITTLTMFLFFVFIEKYFLENEFKEQVLNSSTLNIEKKEKQLNKLIENAKKLLIYIKDSKDFNDAVENKNFDKLENIFLTVSQTNSYFMQLRFIDKDGIERIRTDRNKDLNSVFIVKKENLQDKSTRDYFIKSKDKKEIFVSNLDLNVENGKIEFPFRPTIRIISPILKDDEFIGELIVNLEVNFLFDSMLFNTLITDTQGEVLLPFDKKQKNFDKNIKNYLPISVYENSRRLKKYIYENYISYKFDTEIKNDLILVLKLKDDFYKKFQDDQIEVRILIFGVFILFMIIVIFFVFRKINQVFHFYYKSKLEEKIKFSNKEFNSANTFLSKNIDPELILSQSSTSMILTDKNIKILYVNKAFTNLYGYTKDEVLGKDPGFLRNEDIEQKGIAKLREALSLKCSATVILRNYTKDNILRYIELSISPIFEENSDKIIYYLGIHKDVTKEQKILKDLKRIF